MVVVQKYGGSSVADVEKIRQVAKRVVETRSQGYKVVVVVSAMGNTTNELLALAKLVTANPGRRELDMLISVGERITMALLSMAINDLGVPSVSFTGSQSGIITDERHSSASVIEVRPERVKEALNNDQIVIVAGFQGVSRFKEVTTLGRGGSDTTAVALAAALNAEWCEICSDVDGVYSADPRNVPNTVRLDGLSYEQALALLRGGAKVLHPESVVFAKQHGIEIRAVSTNNSSGGTKISAQKGDIRKILAVTHDGQLARISGPKVLDLVIKLDLPIKRLNCNEAIIDLKDIHQEIVLDENHVLNRIGEVTATGNCRDPGLLKAGISALESKGITVYGFSQDPDRITWIIDHKNCIEAESALHHVLVVSPVETVR